LPKNHHQRGQEARIDQLDVGQHIPGGKSSGPEINEATVPLYQAHISVGISDGIFPNF